MDWLLALIIFTKNFALKFFKKSIIFLNLEKVLNKQCLMLMNKMTELNIQTMLCLKETLNTHVFCWKFQIIKAMTGRGRKRQGRGKDRNFHCTWNKMRSKSLSTITFRNKSYVFKNFKCWYRKRAKNLLNTKSHGSCFGLKDRETLFWR